MLIQISNGHSFSFSRRRSVRALPVPREPREGVERREAPGVCATHPLEAGITYPPRAADNASRAPSDVGRCASRRSTFGHQPSSAIRGPPVRPALALSADGSLSGKRPLIEQDGSMIRPGQHPGIRNRKFFFIKPRNKLPVILRRSPRERRASKDRPQGYADAPATILRDAALTRGPQDDGGV